MLGQKRLISFAFTTILKITLPQCNTYYSKFPLLKHSSIGSTCFLCFVYLQWRIIRTYLFWSTPQHFRHATTSFFYRCALHLRYFSLCFRFEQWPILNTDTTVVVNQTTNGQRFGFIRRLVNSYIAPEWSLYRTIAAVVVVVAALYHYQAINSLEARFETAVEKMLDKREQGSKAFMKEVIQKFETNMIGKFDVLRRLFGR